MTEKYETGIESIKQLHATLSIMEKVVYEERMFINTHNHN